MTDIKTFSNAELGTVRTVSINGEPWFVGKDVTGILGYTNGSKAISDHVDPEDKLNNESLTSLGQRGGWIINESGLYSLILSSKLPAARKFKRWVTNEVLPAVRQTGMYVTEDLIKNPDLAIAAFMELKRQKEKIEYLEAENAVQSQQIAEMKPKVTYHDVVLNCKDAVNITVIAKDYGMSGVRLNELLHELGVQFKQNEIWLLYQRYAGKGYTRTKTYTFEDSEGIVHTKVHTKWTQKGRLFIYDLLKEIGIFPEMEKEAA